MTRFSKIITGSIVALALASTIAATPASAGGYYYRSRPDAGAIAGAAVAGMAVGALVGAAASQPAYGYDYGYGYPAYGYGPAYGYAPAYGYGYGW
ncbi:MAG: hypothetical protein ACR652_18770 [Methylocystis sp.]|uniref:hypothetical protein n=1 Tax=Methylocystis sp. TaxID=1911079 RepID=UPI003DA60139